MSGVLTPTRVDNKHFQHHRQSAAALIDADGLVVASDEMKANMFNNYFAAISIVDDGARPEVYKQNEALFLILLSSMSVVCYLQYDKKLSCRLENRASATYFFVAKLISIAHSCL